MSTYHLRPLNSLIKPLLLSGFLAFTGCAETVPRAEYEAARKNEAETISALREELTSAKNMYEKSSADLKKLVTDRTSIEALIPKVGEAKEDLLKQLQKDYNELTAKWNTEKDALEGTRRTTVSDLEQQKRWFKQTAEPAIGKPKDGKGPAEGMYADREKLENHETRLTNLKNALSYHHIVEEWSYALFLEYRSPIEKEIENLQHKLDALNSVKPEERAKALDTFERDTAAFERSIELQYQQQKEKRKKMPPRPEEK